MIFTVATDQMASASFWRLIAVNKLFALLHDSTGFLFCPIKFSFDLSSWNIAFIFDTFNLTTNSLYLKNAFQNAKID